MCKSTEAEQGKVHPPQHRAHVKSEQRGGWDGGRGHGRPPRVRSPTGGEELSEVVKQAETPNEENTKPETPKRALVLSCQFLSLNRHLSQVHSWLCVHPLKTAGQPVFTNSRPRLHPQATSPPRWSF